MKYIFLKSWVEWYKMHMAGSVIRQTREPVLTLSSSASEWCALGRQVPLSKPWMPRVSGE